MLLMLEFMGAIISLQYSHNFNISIINLEGYDLSTDECHGLMCKVYRRNINRKFTACQMKHCRRGVLQFQLLEPVVILKQALRMAPT
jgi:hypothetical protein